jgi:hypothetical protein
MKFAIVRTKTGEPIRRHLLQAMLHHFRRIHRAKRISPERMPPLPYYIAS